MEIWHAVVIVNCGLVRLNAPDLTRTVECIRLHVLVEGRNICIHNFGGTFLGRQERKWEYDVDGFSSGHSPVAVIGFGSVKISLSRIY